MRVDDEEMARHVLRVLKLCALVNCKIIVIIGNMSILFYFIIESYRKYTKKNNKAPYTRPSLCTGNK